MGLLRRRASSSADAIIDEATWVCLQMADESIPEDQVKYAALTAAAWSDEPSIIAPFILAGLRDFHDLALPINVPENLTQPVPKEARNLGLSHTRHLRAFGERLGPILTIKFDAESAVVITRECVGEINYGKVRARRAASILSFKRAGVRHPGPWITVEHLWDLGFAIGLLHVFDDVAASRS